MPNSFPPNPFIGPAAFEEKDQQRFFGRDAESRELGSLIIARRAVLLYAQSGAGKTSLIQASLMPDLNRRKKIQTLPIARVSGNSQTSYIDNALAMLLPGTAPGLTFAEAFGQYFLSSTSRPAPYLIVFDQFEEIFTFHPTLTKARQRFFAELNACLTAFPQLSLLISMREDYLADMEDFASLLPDRLRTRMRLERLTAAFAREAIECPAERAGLPFEPDATESLLDNLRLNKEGELGPYVEPVQLQIVCSQLWSSLEEAGYGEPRITKGAVERYANVHDVLTQFYRESIRAAVELGVTERQVRNWFGVELITPAKTRGFVLCGDTDAKGLPMEVVLMLKARSIVRTDLMGENPVCELSHDRLVEPVLSDNLAWQAANQNPVTKAFDRYRLGGRSASLLLSGSALQECVAFQAQHPSQVEPEEMAFLKESEKAEADSRSRRRKTIGGAIAVIASLAVATLYSLNQASMTRTAYASLESKNDELNKAVEQKKLEAQAKQTALVAFRAASAEVDRKRQDLQKAFAELNESLRQTKVASKRAIEQEKEARARALSAYALQSIAEDPERAVILGRYALDASMGSSAQTSYIAQEALQNAVLNSQLRATVKMPGTSSIQVAFHPDNQSFATAEWNGEVVVWDLQGRELKRFKTSGGIGSLRYLPSGSHLVIAAYDKLLLHDHTTSKILTSRTNSRIRHFAFDPAASRFAIVYDDRPTQVELFAFDGRLGELTPASPASIDFGSPVAKMDLSPNGGRIAAVTEGQFLKVWDRTIGKFIHDFPAHPLPILDVKFRPGIRNNSEVATSSDDSLIKLWRLGDGLPRLELPTSNLSVFDLAFTQDGRKLVSSNRDNRIRVWDLGRKTVELTLQGPRVGNRISLSRDGTALVSGGEDGTASVWSLVRNEGWLTLPSRSVSISLRDKMAVGARTSLAIYDLQTKKTEKQIAVPDWPSIVAWSPSGKFLAVSGSSGTRLYNPELQEVDTPKLAWAEAIQFSPRNEFFASRSGSMVDVIRLAGTKPTLQSRITIPEDPNIYSLAFDPASKLLAGPSASNALWIWQVRDGALIRKVDPAKDRLSGASFHPDGTSLLVGNWASTAQILDTRSWEKVHELKGHQDYVYDVAYSPDGALIATASNDRSVKLWDSKTRRQLMSLRFEESSAYRVAFSPDGKYLSVGRGSKVDLQYHDTYSVILLNPADLLKFSATRVTRELTPEECLRYFDNPVCPTVQ